MLGLEPLLVGTSPDCDLVVNDPRVSRRRCEVALSERGIRLKDLDSKNGTFIGDVQIVEALLTTGATATFGELPLDLQPKLLRALESRQYRRVGATQYSPFDARVVAATHRNLRARASKHEFREDLYYRLAVVEVNVPPLRERGQVNMGAPRLANLR